MKKLEEFLKAKMDK